MDPSRTQIPSEKKARMIVPADPVPGNRITQEMAS
jgi:hypothetical protein